MLQLQDHLPGFYDFIGIARAEHDHIGHRPQRRKLFNGLVRGAVFSDADRIVGEDEDRWNLHERRQSHAGTHVITEIEECGPKCADAGERHSVYARTHDVLSNPEVQIAPGVASRLEISRSLKLERGLIRGCEVGGASYEPRNILCQGVEDFTGT